MKQTYLITNWAKDFSCPGGDCGLTCCSAEWKIRISDKEIEGYKTLEHKFSGIILEAIDMEKNN